MFNGIVKNTGKIVNINKKNKDCFIKILSRIKFSNSAGLAISISPYISILFMLTLLH